MAIIFTAAVKFAPGEMFHFGSILSIVDKHGDLHRICDVRQGVQGQKAAVATHARVPRASPGGSAPSIVQPWLEASPAWTALTMGHVPLKALFGIKVKFPWFAVGLDRSCCAIVVEAHDIVVGIPVYVGMLSDSKVDGWVSSHVGFSRAHRGRR